MKAVVTGMIATFPVGGVAWDYGQYLIGLERLGFDVYYLEDNAIPLLDPSKGIEGEYGIVFLNETLKKISPNLSERWHVRTYNDNTYGMDREAFKKIIASADIFLNISGGTLLRDEYMRIPTKILLDTDPGKNQFLVFPKQETNEGIEGLQSWKSHDFFYTYAECIGSDKCLIPSLGVRWGKTRPPVVLDCWHQVMPGKKWTTIMSWKGHGDSFLYNGMEFGGKEMEFHLIEDLPLIHDSDFEIALGGKNPPTKHMQLKEWSVVNSVDYSRTLDSYRLYIESSRGELSVAKNVYVATYSGWFSCRSVCYLASSRPVVVQDTGFSELIPTGNGLFAFTNLDEAKLAVEQVEQDYGRHQKAAFDIAYEYFDSIKVIGQMLKEIGLN